MITFIKKHIILWLSLLLVGIAGNAFATEVTDTHTGSGWSSAGGQTEEHGVIIEVHSTTSGATFKIIKVIKEGSVTATRALIHETNASSTDLATVSFSGDDAVFNLTATPGTRYLIGADSIGAGYNRRCTASPPAYQEADTNIDWIYGMQENGVGSGDYIGRSDACNILSVVTEWTILGGGSTTSSSSLDIIMENFYNFAFIILAGVFFFVVAWWWYKMLK